MCLPTLGASLLKLGQSTEPTVTEIWSLSNEYVRLTGVPQLEQNVLSATLDSLNVWRVEAFVTRKVSNGTWTNGRQPEPDTCWHARQ
jgi:hypothetical protein